MTFKVERGIPCPSVEAGMGVRYPFRQMEIGDSFVFPSSLKANVHAAVSRIRAKTSKRFKTLKISETHCRCWRVE